MSRKQSAAGDPMMALLLEARAELAIAASYVDEPGISVGLRVHAKGCARVLAHIDAFLKEQERSKMKVNEPTCKRCGKDVPRGRYTVPRAEIENADTVLDPNEQSVLFCDDCYHVVIYKGQPTVDEWAEQTDAIAYPPDKEGK